MPTKAKYCTGKTRAGARCKARPLKGSKRCAAHPLSPASTRFGSPEQAKAAGKLGGRPRRPRLHEKLEAALEEHAEEFAQIYLEAAQRAVVVAKYEGEVHPSDVPDHGARVQIIERMYDRVHGKPRQAVDVDLPAGSEISPPAAAIVKVDVSDPETRRLAHELVKRLAGRPDRGGAARSTDQPSRSRVARRRKGTTP